MNLIVLGLGAFFAGEGAANLVWWHFFPPQDKTNSKMEMVWEAGRFVRTIGGLILIGVALVG